MGAQNIHNKEAPPPINSVQIPNSAYYGILLPTVEPQSFGTHQTVGRSPKTVHLEI